MLRDDAKQLWLHYVDLARPVSVARIALRYINRIEIPLPFEDYKEYVLTIPEIAPGIPQGLAHFFMRLEIPYPEQFMAIITQTIDQGNMPPNAIPLI